MAACAAPSATSFSVPFAPSLAAAQSQVLTATSVNLSESNFKMIKANAMGTSWGFKLLGLISLKSPHYTEAIARLYEMAGVAEGRAQTIANVVYQNSSTYFILFSLPRITVRADVIEFVDNASLNDCDCP